MPTTAKISEFIHVTIDRETNQLLFSGPAIDVLSAEQRRLMHEHLVQELPAALAPERCAGDWDKLHK